GEGLECDLVIGDGPAGVAGELLGVAVVEGRQRVLCYLAGTGEGLRSRLEVVGVERVEALLEGHAGLLGELDPGLPCEAALLLEQREAALGQRVGIVNLPGAPESRLALVQPAHARERGAVERLEPRVFRVLSYQRLEQFERR